MSGEKTKSRPVYEKPGDLENEKGVAAILGKAWNCEVLKLPKFWPVDYCAVRSTPNRSLVNAWIEIKCRNYSFAELRDLGGYMIDLRKISALRDLAKISEKPAILAVRLTDGIFTMKDVPLIRTETIMGGRKDRGDEADVEPCALIPMSNFKKLDVGTP